MITIRPALLDDAPCLPEIERSSGEIFRQWPGLEWIADDEVQSEQRHRALIASGIALVAEVPGAGLAGFLNAERTADALHIWQFSVHRDQQRRGIGRQLIDALLPRALALGATALTLTTFREVPWNAPYYQRLGFVMLDDAALTPRLRGILEDEGRAAIPTALRCAMCKVLPVASP
ncbi:GNAT family N-acetyltransferase [Pararhodospirillum photometricum]|uniref:GCN5-related N-acetyltransferase n=1 Tax=Pararhodospirillum photometricum DSM 122 TaxID=1150469 RepID=H6SJH2_PARPM|nr:GNAT family N-acetyltransferase [Pararhodospirillum photometricum]CCG08137.1 GCN5-related N-acetyltransferase [Pararhodospirillum photometricum DSM 122]